jgi:dihydroorotase
MFTPQPPRRSRRPNHAAPYDLLIRGGEVVDPSQTLRGVRDVAFAWGRVAAIAQPGTIDADAARQVIDAAGQIVTPGLVDLHTHVYVGGSELVVPADEVCPASGCTTVVDAGTAGANTVLGLRMLAQSQIRTRVYAFVHISCFGLAGHPHGESRDLVYLDPELAARAVLAHQGFVLGVKVRQTASLVGENGLEPLKRAVRAAELAEAALLKLEAHAETVATRPDGPPLTSIPTPRHVPVMVHIGTTPGSIGEVLALLRPGDVVTHSFNGGKNRVVNAEGHMEPAVLEARTRGVRFDVGHGAGSFSYQVAKAAAAQEFWPDTISTDLHSASVNTPVVDLPTTMSKYLNFGLPLEEVVRRSTAVPARFINGALPAAAREPLLGTLQVGAPGDAAVLDLLHDSHQFVDSLGFTWTGAQRLLPLHTVLHGRLWGRPYPHPYLVP